MGTYLYASDFPDVPDAAELIGELEAHLSLHYPALATLPAERKPLLVNLLKPVIRRWGAVGVGLDSTDATGPFTFRTSGGGGHILWPREIADLKALCAGGDPAPDGVPLGAFPPSTDPMFARRPGWL